MKTTNELSNRKEINQKLVELNKIFNQIESYGSNLNFGMRSLKNIGIWLILYAMADEKTQDIIRKEIANQANIISESEKKSLNNAISYLAKANNIKKIIKDYEIAKGSFSMQVSSNILVNFQNKCNAIDPSGELAKRISEAPSSDTVILGMENHIHFAWAGRDGAEKCRLSKNYFRNEQIGFLTVEDSTHKFSYQLCCNENKYYHVVEFKVLENSNATDNAIESVVQDFNSLFFTMKNTRKALENGQKENSIVYFIEPVEPGNHALLRSQYFDILNKKSSKFTVENYEELKQLKQKYALDNILIREKSTEIDVKFYDRDVPIIYNFHVVFHFPKLTEKLTTTENRLGIYSVFSDKTLADCPNISLKYKGMRELIYDEKGGEIYNLESIHLKQSSAGYLRNPRIIKDVYIEYTLSDQFMLVYAAKKTADFYPFIISDPQRNLNNNFVGHYNVEDNKQVSHDNALGGYKNLTFQAKKEQVKPNEAQNNDNGCECRIQ